MGRMEGKVAVVFGVGPNNGGTIAHFMAREGAKIFACDIASTALEDTVTFLRSRGYEADGTLANGWNEPDVDRAVSEAVKRFGYVDTLVNLSGHQVRNSILDVTLAEFRECTSTYLEIGRASCRERV